MKHSTRIALALSLPIIIALCSSRALLQLHQIAKPDVSVYGWLIPFWFEPGNTFLFVVALFGLGWAARRRSISGALVVLPAVIVAT